ncbi:hypothetical protein LMH87_010729 [Akanthomyces muscarius]|uniref:Uncharacterized protein n=1 Tax=Akanthomyces muscarius TaxID=2231603 RepID=A0A9W8Q9W9_AKAMU|nr:hypothetical protein LMH87_010729 [Akanthomyces muscarius]KAJ4149957.1 hypothetical protein LMH87_010729 [Akanthomyces muscarius]
MSWRLSDFERWRYPEQCSPRPTEYTGKDPFSIFIYLFIYLFAPYLCKRSEACPGGRPDNRQLVNNKLVIRLAVKKFD